MGRSPSQRRRRAAVIGFLGLIAMSVGPAQFPIRIESAARAGTAAAVEISIGSNDLDALQQQFQMIAEKVSPAVVAISASTTADISPAALRTADLNAERLQSFLSKTTRMVGTGFVVSADGFIVTNDHVIDEAEQLWITTDDKKVYPALVVGSDPRSDLAVLKIPARGLPTVRYQSTGNVRRGEWAIAVGNPFGLSGEGQMCISVGVVSAINRSLPKLSDKENRLYTNLIQTTAQINPGNSGGPLFNLRGEVIGVNTAVIMPQKSSNGIGFAMPIDARFLAMVEELKQGHEIVYGYLGVSARTPTSRESGLAGVKENVGARVDSVQHDSPAAGKLLDDDLIVGIDGQSVADSDDFIRVVGASPVATPVAISLVRSGKPRTISVQLRKRPQAVEGVTRENQRLRWEGMLLGAVPAGANDGVGVMVFGIDPASPFTKLGVHEGTVITTVAGKTVKAVSELQDIINDTRPEECRVEIAPDQNAKLATAVELNAP